MRIVVSVTLILLKTRIDHQAVLHCKKRNVVQVSSYIYILKSL